MLKITGVGKNYSGTYRVAKAVHMLRGGGGYETQFVQLRRRAHACSARPAAATAARGAIDSIVVGIVTNNNDPESSAA